MAGAGPAPGNPGKASDTPVPGRKIIHCGNPGSGKSTSLNSLVGYEAFQAGVSIGDGLTTHLHKVEHNGVVYIDTPGLDDISKAQQAGAEIEKALKAGGDYKITFFMVVHSGRVLPADVWTAAKILDAAPSIQDYGIVINKVSKKVKKEMENPENLEKMLDHFAGNLRNLKPQNVVCLPNDPDLEDETNVVKPPHPEYKQLLAKLEFQRVEPQTVRAIDCASRKEDQEKIKKAQDAAKAARQSEASAYSSMCDAWRAADDAREGAKQVEKFGGRVLKLEAAGKEQVFYGMSDADKRMYFPDAANKNRYVARHKDENGDFWAIVCSEDNKENAKVFKLPKGAKKFEESTQNVDFVNNLVRDKGKQCGTWCKKSGGADDDIGQR